MKSNDGSILKHFTPFPTPQTSGVNVFAQEILNGERTSRKHHLLMEKMQGTIQELHHLLGQ
jgi:hypothetical protein